MVLPRPVPARAGPSRHGMGRAPSREWALHKIIMALANLNSQSPRSESDGIIIIWGHCHSLTLMGRRDSFRLGESESDTSTGRAVRLQSEAAGSGPSSSLLLGLSRTDSRR
jgi:hypothetical protein